MTAYRMYMAEEGQTAQLLLLLFFSFLPTVRSLLTDRNCKKKHSKTKAIFTE